MVGGNLPGSCPLHYERCRQPPWPWNIELAGGRDSHLLHWFLAGTIAGIGDLEIGDISPQLLRTCEDTHPSQQSRPRAHQVRARERVKTTLFGEGGGTRPIRLSVAFRIRQSSDAIHFAKSEFRI